MLHPKAWAMTRTRKKLEEYFIPHLKVFLESEFEVEAELDAEQVDNPDTLFTIGEKRVAIELSQFPDKYIIHEFHKKIEKPQNGEQLFCVQKVFPFEPHRWVHQALVKKTARLPNYRKNVEADEYWLALHAHSEHTDWPMSQPEQEERRRLEYYLMKFGAQSGTTFDRVIYFYRDGSVAKLTGYGECPLTKLSSALESGYPSVSSFSIYLTLEVPAEGDPERFLEFSDVDFEQKVIEPNDTHWRTLAPDIRQRTLDILVNVSSTEAVFQFLINGKKYNPIKCSTRKYAGSEMDAAILVEGDLNEFKLQGSF